MCLALFTVQDKKEKEELDARVKLLSELDEKYEDLGACHVPHRPQACSSGVAAPGVQGCAQLAGALGMLCSGAPGEPSQLKGARIQAAPLQAPCWTVWCGTMARSGRRRWTPQTCTNQVRWCKLSIKPLA